MSRSPQPATLLRESVPLAGILAVWIVPSQFLIDGTGQALFAAGLIMATLYAVGRGARLADRCSPTPAQADVLAALRENAWVFAVASVWFLAAIAVWFVSSLFVEPEYVPVIGSLVFVLNGAGVGTVLIYAVAVGRARLSGDAAGRNPGRGSSTDAPAPADD